MARRDEEGFFYIVDRMKDMIITGGENVYCREVEEVLYTPPGGVARPPSIGLPDPTWGENVTAVVVLRAGHDGHRGRDHRHRAATAWPGSRSRSGCIFLDELPKTVSGKILKRELRDRFTPG